MTEVLVCPCRAGEEPAASQPIAYEQCCGRFHQSLGERQALDQLSESLWPESPEALMRSRYSAFALGLSDYLKQSWHPSTRPVGQLIDPSVRWLGLVVEEAEYDDADTGFVCFRARFSAEEDGNNENGKKEPNKKEHSKKVFNELAECSRFVRVDGRWLYLDGEPEWRTLSPGRNDPCPCGSGRKFKKCCAS